MINEKKARQLAEMPRGNRSAAGDPDDQARYLKSKGRMIDGLMRQFIKGDGGPRGNSAAYCEGWDRIFGKKAANG